MDLGRSSTSDRLVFGMSNTPSLPEPPAAPAAPTLADLAAAPAPDPVVTVAPTLEDLAKAVEDAQLAHVKATDQANASAAQAQKDKDAQTQAHDALHSAVGALVAAAQADDPA